MESTQNLGIMPSVQDPVDSLPTNQPPPDGWALPDTTSTGFLVVLAAGEFAGSEEDGQNVRF